MTTSCNCLLEVSDCAKSSRLIPKNNSTLNIKRMLNFKNEKVTKNLNIVLYKNNKFLFNPKRQI